MNFIAEKVAAFIAEIMALFSEKPHGNREQRRNSKRISGRKNPDGKYYGGVAPDKKHRVQRFLADKGEL